LREIHTLSCNNIFKDEKIVKQPSIKVKQVIQIMWTLETEKRDKYRAAICACRAFDNPRVFAFSLSAMAVRDFDLKQKSNKEGKQTQIVQGKHRKVKSKPCNAKTRLKWYNTYHYWNIHLQEKEIHKEKQKPEILPPSALPLMLIAHVVKARV